MEPKLIILHAWQTFHHFYMFLVLLSLSFSGSNFTLICYHPVTTMHTNTTLSIILVLVLVIKLLFVIYMIMCYPVIYY